MVRIFVSFTLIVAIWPALAAGQDAPEPSTPDEVGQEEADDDQDQETASPSKKGNNPYTSDALDPASPDEGYGEHDLAPQNRFATTLAEQATVDTRFESSSMGDRNIAMPTAETPGKGDIVWSTYNILMNQLTYGVSDDLSLTLGGNIPTADADFIATFSGKYQIVDNRSYSLSVQGFTAYANGVRTMDTLQWGIGAGVLYDLKVHDAIVLHFAGFGFANLLYGADEYDFSNCQGVTRSEFLESDCREVTTSVTGLPNGGHWIAGSAGATFYPFKNVGLHAELIVAGVSGTFFGVEHNGDAQDAADPDPPDTAPFEEPTLKLGFPHNGGPTGSLAASWSDGNFGLQLALLFFGNNDDPATRVVDESQETRILPVLSGSYAF